MKKSVSHSVLTLVLFFAAESAVHASTLFSQVITCVPSVHQIKPLSLTPTLRVYPAPAVTQWHPVVAPTPTH